MHFILIEFTTHMQINYLIMEMRFKIRMSARLTQGRFLDEFYFFLQ